MRVGEESCPVRTFSHAVVRLPSQPSSTQLALGHLPNDLSHLAQTTRKPRGRVKERSERGRGRQQVPVALADHRSQLLLFAQRERPGSFPRQHNESQLLIKQD